MIWTAHKFFKYLLKRLADTIWRDSFFLMIFATGTMLSTAAFRERTFLLHCFYVTHMLLTVLVRLGDAYGRFPIPYNDLRQIIIVAGMLHLINPLLMLVQIKHAILVHVPICVLVHILHLSYVMFIFDDMGYSDSRHTLILVLLNCLEAATNFAIMAYPNAYFLLALATEAICPFVLIFRMKRGRKGNGRCCCGKKVRPSSTGPITSHSNLQQSSRMIVESTRKEHESRDAEELSHLTRKQGTSVKTPFLDLHKEGVSPKNQHTGILTCISVERYVVKKLCKDLLKVADHILHQ